MRQWMTVGTKKVWSAVGAVLGIASPLVGVLLWLLLFNSYRLEKQMLVKQVVKHLRAPDICNMTAGTSYPIYQAAIPPTPNPLMLTSANSTSSSGQLLLEGPPSAGLAGMSTGRSVSYMYDPDDPIMLAEPAGGVQKVAREITLRCLQRWDGFMGFRASRDSLGGKSGIWRERFDGVRFATLLLAFRRLNESLAYTLPGNTGGPEPCAPLDIVTNDIHDNNDYNTDVGS